MNVIFSRIILANGGDIKIGGIEEYLQNECADDVSESPEDEEEDVELEKMEEEDEEEAVSSE